MRWDCEGDGAQAVVGVRAIFEDVHYDRAHAEGLAGAVGDERDICGGGCHNEGDLRAVIIRACN